MNRRMLLVLALTVLAATTASAQIKSSTDDARAAAQAAEQAGDKRTALQLYAELLRNTPDTVAEEALRKKLFELAADLTPPPALPDSALIFDVRAEAAFNAAQNRDDFIRALLEYHKAIRYAPWVPRFYFNLAVLAEKANDVPLALKYYRIYLQSPAIPDANEVRRKMISLEYNAERQAAALAAEKAKYANVDQFLGEYGYYLKKDPENTKFLSTKCYMVESQCSGWKFKYADTLSVRPVDSKWKQIGYMDLKRRGDTLFVEGRGIAYHGVMKSPDAASANWFYHGNDSEKYAHCSGFSATATYAAHLKIAQQSSGPELMFTSNSTFPNVVGSCIIMENPEYDVALAKPVLYPPIQAGQAISAELTPDDLSKRCSDWSCYLPGYPYKGYVYQGEAGQKVEIALSSPDFDAKVWLYYKSDDGYTFVAYENKGGTGDDALLKTTLTRDGEYVVVATSNKPPNFGRFSLMLNVAGFNSKVRAGGAERGKR